MVALFGVCYTKVLALFARCYTKMLALFQTAIFQIFVLYKSDSTFRGVLYESASTFLPVLYKSAYHPKVLYKNASTQIKKGKNFHQATRTVCGTDITGISPPPLRAGCFKEYHYPYCHSMNRTCPLFVKVHQGILVPKKLYIYAHSNPF